MLASRSDQSHSPGLALASDTRGGIGARRARAGGLLERRETLAVGKTGEASGPITGLGPGPQALNDSELETGGNGPSSRSSAQKGGASLQRDDVVDDVARAGPRSAAPSNPDVN